VHEDLIEEVAGVEGGVVGWLDETDDAVVIGCDEERKVCRGELCESRRRNDECWCAAELLGCGLGLTGRFGLSGGAGYGAGI
jgi:hypothetical protein